MGKRSAVMLRGHTWYSTPHVRSPRSGLDARLGDVRPHVHPSGVRTARPEAHVLRNVCLALHQYGKTPVTRARLLSSRGVRKSL